jgi:cellulose synthase/poly-beta-1,6-N-acetylglucosamine synthase-like glycosyltransferase
MDNTLFYRLMEIAPAALSWLTLVGMVAFSFLVPAWMSFFIIVFDVYWFLRTAYFSVYLRNSYRKLNANLATDWLAKLKDDERTAGAWEKLYHLIVLPMYREDYEVVRETFARLRASNYPLDKFFVVLALEERAGEHAQDVARKISDEFGDAFAHLLVTTHPKDLPGEKPGKSSNETWAALAAQREIIDARGIPYRDVIISVFDVDTQIYKDYFGILTHTFLTAEKPLRSSYQPVPLFLNNVFEAPMLSRLIGFSGTFWHLMQQSAPEKLVTFSSHSMPFEALVEIGFWDKDIVSEDSRVFFQCLLRYEGDWRTVPLFYPVSMDANVAPTFWGTMLNIYKQQRRWAWGAENFAYLMAGFRKAKGITSHQKGVWAFRVLEGFHSWATNSLMLFSLGWLPVLAGGQAFRITMLAYNLPKVTQWIMTLTSVGIVTTAILSVMLLPPKPASFRWYHYFLYLASWILMPISLIVFGSFPALEAQTRLAFSGKWRLDFWVTPKQRLAKEAKGKIKAA